MTMRTRQEILRAIHHAILEGDAETAAACTQDGLDTGFDPLDLLYEAMIPALEEVGSRFEAGEYFLPEMLVAAQAMQASMEIVRPLLGQADREPVATFVIGTVAGDIHDIGKNLCIAMLESAGFRVIDLGVNVTADDFVEAIRSERPDAVGMSAFLTTTMREIDRNIEAIETAGFRDDVKVLVGGALMTEDHAEQAGADGYAPDASSAVRVTRRLLGIAEPTRET